MYVISARQGLARTLAITSCAIVGSIAHAQLSGAIFTTKPDGNTVNANLYTDIKDVYLNGGPRNTSSAGLQDGIYFFQVTNPNGHDLLSTTLATDRFVVVNNGRFEGRSDFYGTPGNHMPGGTSIVPHKESAAPAINGGIGVQLWPFNKTTNQGGEYKAWLILYRKDKDSGTGKDYSDSTTYSQPNTDGYHIDFAHRWSKTDNFKIKEKNPEPAKLCGMKWFDFNMDGDRDSGEPTIAGFIIKVILNNDTSNPIYVTTDASGYWELSGIPAGTPYKVSEVLPPTSPYGSSASDKWVQTSPGAPGDDTDDRGYSGLANGTICNLDFGNTQLIKLAGTKFYDSNMNGVMDGTEAPVAGIEIDGSITTPDGVTTPYTLVTDANGHFEILDVPVKSSYSFSEVIGGAWKQTAPAGNSYAGTITADLGDSDPALLTLYYTVDYNRKDITNLDFGNILLARIYGKKFFDTNNNHALDSGEPGIQNIHIVIDYTLPNGVVCQQTVYTDSNGNWKSKLLPDGTTYVVHEVLPPTGNWQQTFPSASSYSGTIGVSAPPYTGGSTIANVTGLNFGNNIIIRLNAHTKGFWHNQNGYAAMNDGGTIVPELTMLNDLCLVRLDGSPADFNIVSPSLGFADFSNWITSSSNGSNMACQLSAQFAAMKLNVEAGYVSGGQLIYAPGAYCANSQGIAVLSDLLAETAAALCADPVTVTSSTARSHQTALEQALDRGNNNLNWVGVPIVIVTPY